MEDEQSPRRLIKRKPIASRPSHQRKPPSPFSPFQPTSQDQRKLLIEVREAERNIGLKINEQNISLIAKKQEMSFISNRQDHSMDSFDKMIMGVDQELDIEEENTSNSKEHEPNYSLLYQEFQRLIKTQKYQKADLSAQIEQGSGSILQEEMQGEEEDKSKQISFDLNAKSLILQRVVKDRIEDVKHLRRHKSGSAQSSTTDPNISLRLAGASLSQIHEEEIQHNESISRMDPIEEQFIDFVSKDNDAGRINISKIEKNSEGVKEKKVQFKNELNTSLKAEVEQDEVVAMLQNELGSRRDNIVGQESLLEDQASISKIKHEKEEYEKGNYNQILRELDENEDNKKLDNSNAGHVLSTIICKREEWINSRRDKSHRWRQRQLQLLLRMKEIAENPYIEFSDQQESGLQE